ncbi:F-box family protein [Striga asiatica]|uniref:F-box family protein n=1 Tax=Striga asiatica TaxID=4170 RepID=A0A5A7PV51_STRAF|nr:F-box family protein [Striga asiatica]
MADESGNPPASPPESARWPPANTSAFVTAIVHNGVTAGIVGPTMWDNITSHMLHSCPGYNYSTKQLKGKFYRLKSEWKKYHTLLKSDPRFEWDDFRGIVIGSPDCWARRLAANPKDAVLRRRRCPHYRDLTAIFDEGFGENEPLVHSFTEVSRSLSQEVESSGPSYVREAITRLESMQDLPNKVFCVAMTKFEDPFWCQIFSLITTEERRRTLLDYWVEESEK